MTSSAKDITDITNILTPADRRTYTSCYCEENVYHLCREVKNSNDLNLISNSYAVFISNEKQIIPLWRQKVGKGDEKVVLWDYHVILVYKSDDTESLVFDLDTELEFPMVFKSYCEETFKSEAILKSDYHRYFRILPASLFLTKFSSDRRHMKADDGSWIKPPPNYPCIRTPDNDHNLDRFISMVEDNEGNYGEVKNLNDFVEFFSAK